MNAEDQTVTQERTMARADLLRPQARGDKIKVAIADDHAFVREALRLYLASFPDVECVGEANDGAEAVRLVQSNDVDVLVLDLCMPHVNGVETIQRLRSLATHAKVVVFSSSPDRLPAGSHEEGVVAVRLEKGCHPVDIMRAIRYAARLGSANTNREDRRPPARS